MNRTYENRSAKNTTTVQDAQLRLDQLKEGHLPAQDTPVLASTLYARAYDGYLHHGTICNTLREGTDSEGGYLVQDEFEKKIVERLRGKNVLRSLATVIPTKRLLKIPVAVGGGQAYWVPEEGLIPSSECRFDQLQLDAHKLGCMIRASDELLEDSAFDIADYIAGSFAERLSAAEEEAFLDGDGNGKPLGLSVNTVKSYCQRNRVQRTNDTDGVKENCDVCRQCGTALVHTLGRKKKLFCSDACRLQWWHAHRDMSKCARECRCMACGKVFRTDRVQKYCSHGCYIAMRFGGNHHGSNTYARAV